MKAYNKQLLKIYRKIDKISLGGKDNIFRYQDYVDELVDKSRYTQFQDCMTKYFNIDINEYVDVEEVKGETWSRILFTTNSSTQKRIKDIYDKEEVYQQSFDVYDLNTNVILGQIHEIDAFAVGEKYSYLDKEFATRTGLKAIYLEVFKGTEFLLITDTDEEIDEYRNQIIRYQLAIDFLKS
jgi:hypothetical protein